MNDLARGLSAARPSPNCEMDVGSSECGFPPAGTAARLASVLTAGCSWCFGDGV